jgi:hypothetical protein
VSTTTSTTPSGVTLLGDLPKTSVCVGCGAKVPAAKATEHWFVHRASGGVYTKSRHGCRTFEASYRKGLAADLAAEKRVPKRRKAAETPDLAAATAKPATKPESAPKARSRAKAKPAA